MLCWENHRSAFFGARVFHPNTDSYRDLECSRYTAIKRMRRSAHTRGGFWTFNTELSHPLFSCQRAVWEKNACNTIADWRSWSPSRKEKIINNYILDEVFVISRIIKVEVRVISRSRRLRLITLTETLIILDITKTESNNCFIVHWTQKLGSHVSISSLTARNTSRAKLTWLPLEIMHCGHTWKNVYVIGHSPLGLFRTNANKQW